MPLLGPLLDRGERLLRSTTGRLALSFLIVLSVLPEAALEALLPREVVAALPAFFLVVFVPELVLRAAVYARRRRRGTASGTEPWLLVLDLLAVISFLPHHGLLVDVTYLRLFRLTRMLLLLGYWGGTLRELWSILTHREWRQQIVVVLGAGVLLAFAAAVVLATLGARFDFDGDGVVTPEDRRFGTLLWWSFLQVEDPGNLVRHPTELVVVAASVGLTLSGVLLFSLLVGIGTSAVEELLARSRERPVHLTGHTVVLGLGSYSELLLGELAELYEKNAKRLRAGVMGPEVEPPEWLQEPRYRSVHYRRGHPMSAPDLVRLDLQSAKRLLVLGGEGADPDAEVISAILAARTVSADVALYPVLEHERNFHAAAQAGGPRTHLVGAGSFLGHYLAQNLLYPGIHRLYRQLLTSSGCEIYTYVFAPEERRQLRTRPALAPLDLQAWAMVRGVTLLGVLLGPPEADQVEVDELAVRLNLVAASAASLPLDPVHGLVGICLRWEQLRALCRDLAAGAEPPPVPDPGQAGLRTAHTAQPLRRLLICGASPRLPRLLRVLVELEPRLHATVLVRRPELLAQLAGDLEAAFGGQLAGPPGEAPLTVERRDAADGVTLAVGPSATVRLLPVDWTDSWQLLRRAELELAGLDVLLFAPHEREGEETDGMVALDMLRVCHYLRSGVHELAAGLRVIGLVRDPTKGDLLERRLAEVDGHDRSRFTVIASERPRHHYVVQNLFVRGLNRVYLELLGASGQRLERVEPEPSGNAPHDVTALAASFARHHGVVLVGLELAQPGGGSEVVLDPLELARRSPIEPAAILGLYLLGLGLEGRATPPEPRRYRLQPASLGRVRPDIDLDHALRLSGELEDLEIKRKLELRK